MSKESGRVIQEFDGREFGYTKITVETPMAGAATSPSSRKTGKRLPDPSKRDTENVPLNEDVNAYLKREVLPYNPEAYIDTAK